MNRFKNRFQKLRKNIQKQQSSVQNKQSFLLKTTELTDMIEELCNVYQQELDTIMKELVVNKCFYPVFLKTQHKLRKLPCRFKELNP